MKSLCKFLLCDLQTHVTGTSHPYMPDNRESVVSAREQLVKQKETIAYNGFKKIIEI
jgi:hypothetical protein